MTFEQSTLADYISAFRRRARLFAMAFVACVAIAVIVATVLPDVYQSTAEIRIDLEGPGVDLLEPLELTIYADQYVRSLQQKVLSQDRLSEWLEEFESGLERQQDAPTELTVGEIRGGVRIDMATIEVLGGDGRPVDLIAGFYTSHRASSPQLAHHINRHLSEAFLAEDQATRNERAAAAAEFLQGQIEQQRSIIDELDAEIAAFKQANADSLPEMRNLNMTVLDRTERDREIVQDDIRRLQQDKIFREAQLEEIRRGSASAERLAELEEEYFRLTAIYEADHPDVIRIKRQVAAMSSETGDESSSPEIARLQVELAEARERYTDEHPTIASLERRIEALRLSDRVRTGSENSTDPMYLQLRAQINAIDTELASLRARLPELRARFDKYQADLGRMPQVEREYLALTRDRETAQLAFEDLRRRLTQAQQTQSFEAGERGARLSLVQSASLPGGPSSPPRAAIVILGLILGSALAGAIALGAEALDNTVRGARDIRLLLQTQPIVAIPVVQNSITKSQRRLHFLLSSIVVLVIVAVIVFARGFQF